MTVTDNKTPRLGMVIDLKRCYGCYACVTSCKTENFTPPGVFWSRVLKGETGTYPNTVRQPLPVLCMQCDDPSCMHVCPTGATYQTDDGVVHVDKNKCIGCNYCSIACPYGARYAVEEWESYFPEGLPLSEYEKFAKQQWEERSGVGVSTKCDFCSHRREDGMLPACVRAYPDSEVSQLIRKHGGMPLNPEHGNKPKVYYLPIR